jgi:hypothetical protein
MTIVSVNMEQPGRLYNRAPVNLDPFLTEHQQPRRRKLQQVSSYHDLDDIPTMSAMSEMKARGGVRTESSPLTVTDTKHFDPVAFQDDIGGVSIDLCLPETDDHEDYFLLREEEPEETREPIQQLSRPSFLAPILEERRVTFAAQHVVMKVDNFDSCTIDQRFVHQVVDAVQVWFIPHHTNYSESERFNMWYSKAEMSAMRQSAIEHKKAKKRARKSLQAAQQKQADTCSLFESPFDMKVTHLEGPTEVEHLSSSERRGRYESMIDSVLLEQYEQRRLCLRVYGRIEQGFTGIIDPERLAEVYVKAGKTSKALERALAKANKLLLALEQDENDDDRSVSSASSAASSVSGSKKQNSNNKLKRSPSFNASAIEVETVQCLDKGVGAIFNALLSPFLEIRKDNLFLGVGEEMSVPL